MRTARSGRRAGFTILELMVTITLAAFLITLSIGALMGSGKAA